ncbi:lysoplasmalogenase [Pedobacter heparinus]|uniref:YhhN family protein n=1 Tax=Pedobacter heparinus (strain ATCC 13125 / DSM 2366 / CIP 104194 / JCM 7457 / NBRC 12017 / NCIMB 9290 / NRRL B-14731 / HIM 762-3) TaxID=485917 RepID=C6XXX9_PEDHD|nr:lysoplasmalogenase [Pedobacter heparinus]ACU04397.1 YhhN family protein [Pedobacter heparinus DSM 2366]
MLKKQPWFHLLFVVVFILQLLSVWNSATALAAFSKPLIVISLLIMLSVSTRLKGRFHKRIFTGLVFALAGDVLLMYAAGNEKFFIWGLAAFLLCHLFYIRAFYLDFKSAPELDKKGARIAIFCCAILAISFYFYLRPQLGIMKLPVMVYILVISMMMMMACFRNQRVNSSSFKLILFGALFFVFSDGILAYNKFVSPISHSGVWIMASYMIAQYLITMGAVERTLLHNQPIPEA